MTIEPQEPNSLVLKTGGAVLGTLIGICFAGPLGAGAGSLVGAGITPVMENWLGRCADEFRRRGTVMADAAGVASHLPEDEVVQQVLADGEVAQPLVSRILEAAMRTDSDHILRLLGAVLGEHVSCRSRRVDEDMMLVDCIACLEASHIRVLEVVELRADGDNPNVGWSIDAVSNQLDEQLSPLGLNSAVGGLLSRGLIESTSGFGGGIIYFITDFGRALLAALRWADTSKPRS